MKLIIESICNAYYESRNRSVCGQPTLKIVGDPRNPFEKALGAACKKFGVPYEIVTRENLRDVSRIDPVVVDKEAINTLNIGPGAAIGIEAANYGVDIDDGSACALGVEALLTALGVPGKTVVIIGRGHAVDGLAPALIRRSATVISCNSKTPPEKIQSLVDLADYVVNASPYNGFTVDDGKTVLDVSGVMENPDYNCGDIGALTTTILAYRASWYRVKLHR